MPKLTFKDEKGKVKAEIKVEGEVVEVPMTFPIAKFPGKGLRFGDWDPNMAEKEFDDYIEEHMEGKP